jgi:hypothetical protein
VPKAIKKAKKFMKVKGARGVAKYLNIQTNEARRRFCKLIGV